MSAPPVSPAVGSADIRPVVRTGSSSNAAIWVFGAVLVLGGLLLVQALSSRRANLAAPPTSAAADGARISAPPPLRLPDSYPEAASATPTQFVQRQPPVPLQRPPSVSPLPTFRVAERQPNPPPLAEPFQTMSQGPARISLPPSPVVLSPVATAPAQGATEDLADRVAAMRLGNPAFTIPKGTIVAAVLETALDSTRPGGVRAIVSRDVRSFDGSRILIPRGSRLYGEYAADVSSGQKRALITWVRLTRPDAVTINLDSPAADPLGRAGVEGRVNTHFFGRFGSAILQSVLDVGVGLATRRLSDDTVVVALPGSTQQIAPQIQQQVQPTLRVRHGASVSVFVSRDLDFSTVDG